jgi:RNA polymerase sigma-70 factor (ECF subfamily)
MCPANVLRIARGKERAREPSGEPARDWPGDGALLERTARGELAAFEALYRVYHPRLHRFIQRIVRRPAAVEEVLNDTMYVVWSSAGRFNGQSKVSTWIFGIAFRQAMKARARTDEPVPATLEDRPDESNDGPEAQAAARETRTRLAHALRRLSPDHQAVIALAYFEGCSCQEVATIMDCPLGTVKTRMFHARRQLRDALGNRS